MKETPLTKTEIEELEGAPIKEQRLTVSDVELGPLDELIYTPGGGGIVLREGDFGPPSIATDTFRRVSTPLSATKTLTEPTRSLLVSPGSGIASEYLRSVDAPSSVQALVGLPADILQTGLGALGNQIGGIEMPSFNMPDYSQQFTDLQTGLGTLGEATQRDVQQRLAALTGIGSQQRALQQASLDIGYEDFLRQQDFPQQQLGFFSNILRGVPVQPQRTVSQYQQQPGLFQQALGLGLGGLGLYRGMS